MSPRTNSTREKFLAEHKYCCFCGGTEPAVEEDHVPPRVVFDNREWPEGYVFPACEVCNRSTRLQDQLLGLLARIGEHSMPMAEEVSKTFGGVRNNQPNNLPSLPKTRREIRHALRELDVSRPIGTALDDVSLVFLESSTIDELDRFWWKLFCALYYKHMLAIFPKSGVIFKIISTNQFIRSPNAFSWMAYPQIQNEPIIQRSGRSLIGQFDYLWGFEEATNTFGVSLHIRNSLFAVLASNGSQGENIPEDGRLMFPLGNTPSTGLS